MLRYHASYLRHFEALGKKKHMSDDGNESDANGSKSCTSVSRPAQLCSAHLHHKSGHREGFANTAPVLTQEEFVICCGLKDIGKGWGVVDGVGWNLFPDSNHDCSASQDYIITSSSCAVLVLLFIQFYPHRTSTTSIKYKIKKNAELFYI